MGLRVGRTVLFSIRPNPHTLRIFLIYVQRTFTIMVLNMHLGSHVLQTLILQAMALEYVLA